MKKSPKYFNIWGYFIFQNVIMSFQKLPNWQEWPNVVILCYWEQQIFQQGWTTRMKESWFMLSSNYPSCTNRIWNSLEGLPSKYYPCSMLLNFTVRKGTGVSNRVTPTIVFFLVKRVPGQGPEQRESGKTVIYRIIVIIKLISNIIIKLLIKRRTIPA